PPILGIYTITFSVFSRNLLNTLINNAVSKKGIAIPTEYINNRYTPLETVAAPPAYMRIDANTGPKHGVHPAAKAIPIKMELNQLETFLGAFFFFSISKNLNFIIPIMFKPKITIKAPLILEKISLFL